MGGSRLGRDHRIGPAVVGAGPGHRRRWQPAFTPVALLRGQRSTFEPHLAPPATTPQTSDVGPATSTGKPARRWGPYRWVGRDSQGAGPATLPAYHLPSRALHPPENGVHGRLFQARGGKRLAMLYGVNPLSSPPLLLPRYPWRQVPISKWVPYGHTHAS
jgi:hypothetical protein